MDKYTSFKIRKATLADVIKIATIHAQAMQETYMGLVPDDYLKQRDYNNRLKMWTTVLTEIQQASARKAVFVAEFPPDDIVGFCSCGTPFNPTTYDSELYTIYLLRRCQHRGIGYALFLQGVQYCFSQGFHSMILHVLKTNANARRFYERLGGELCEGYTETNGIVLVTYLWKDLSSLIYKIAK